MTFTNAQDYARSRFQCYAASKGDSCGDCPLWVYGFSRLGRWKWFQSLGIPYQLCHLNVTKGTLWLSYNPVYGPQAFSPSRSLSLWFPKCCCLSNATTSGCGKLLSLRHPLESAPKEKEGAFLTSQEAASSPLCRTLKGGAGKGTKCGWEVSKASEDSCFTDLSWQLAFDFSPGGGRR